MQFRLWIEAELNSYTKKHLDVRDEFTIQKDISGWPVYFVDYIGVQNADKNKERNFLSRFYHNKIAPIYRNWVFRFQKAVQSDFPYVKEALSRVRQLGLAKSFTVPIIIYYIWDDADDRRLGHAKFGKWVGEATYPVAKPYAPPPTVANPTNKNYRMGHIVVWRRENQNQQEMVKTIAHEIGHHIYAALNAKQKQLIMQLAHSTKAPTTYGSPSYKAKPEKQTNFTSGNEWFSEMIANVMLYNDPSQRGWMKRVMDFLLMKQSPYEKNVYGALRGMVRSVNKPYTGSSKLIYEPIKDRLR